MASVFDRNEEMKAKWRMYSDTYFEKVGWFWILLCFHTGLCGSYNNKVEDDFMSSQSILEKTSQAFASSWEMMPCPKGSPSSCISIENGKVETREKCHEIRNLPWMWLQQQWRCFESHTQCVVNLRTTTGHSW